LQTFQRWVCHPLVHHYLADIQLPGTYRLFDLPLCLFVSLRSEAAEACDSGCRLRHAKSKYISKNETNGVTTTPRCQNSNLTTIFP
jgi:hypothetical protein